MKEILTFVFVSCLQAIELGDALEVKYTGWLWTNNSFGKVNFYFNQSYVISTDCKMHVTGTNYLIFRFLTATLRQIKHSNSEQGKEKLSRYTDHTQCSNFIY